jgi:AmmeMemoRadiSam system protein A
MSLEKKDIGVDLGLSDEEKRELHEIARTVIETRAKGEKPPSFRAQGGKLTEKRGAFVSIHKMGMLRGCIGSLEPQQSLYETIEEMSQAAAFRDPRFAPVVEEELPYLEIEISVLTPMEKITDPALIQVGKHGILIRKGYRSGLLLPQVAAERNWDYVTFLNETCRKAGLPTNAWKDEDTEIYVFSADVF